MEPPMSAGKNSNHDFPSFPRRRESRKQRLHSAAAITGRRLSDKASFEHRRSSACIGR
jgi:hypothetical protein